MIGSVLIIFICILAYHCFIQLKQSRLTRRPLEKVKLTLMKYKRRKQEDQTSVVDEVSLQSTSQTLPTMTVVDLEESLLQQDSENHSPCVIIIDYHSVQSIYSVLYISCTTDTLALSIITKCYNLFRTSLIFSSVCTWNQYRDCMPPV